MEFDKIMQIVDFIRFIRDDLKNIETAIRITFCPPSTNPLYIADGDRARRKELRLVEYERGKEGIRERYDLFSDSLSSEGMERPTIMSNFISRKAESVSYELWPFQGNAPTQTEIDVDNCISAFSKRGIEIRLIFYSSVLITALLSLISAISTVVQRMID